MFIWCVLVDCKMKDCFGDRPLQQGEVNILYFAAFFETVIMSGS